jgi:hypothetical protein
MANVADITAAQLRAILDYNPETGVFRWRARTPDMFSGAKNPSRACAIWNAKYAEAVSGSASSGQWVAIPVNGKFMRAHRIAWVLSYGFETEFLIDHINRNPLDNRLCNLREATPSQNQRNRGMDPRNKSGFKGVSMCRHTQRWRVTLSLNRKQIHVGRFDCLEKAVEAYQEAAAKYHGVYSGVLKNDQL